MYNHFICGCRPKQGFVQKSAKIIERKPNLKKPALL